MAKPLPPKDPNQKPPSPFNSPVDFSSPNFAAGPGLDDDFRGFLHKAGALGLMLDPVYQQSGQALLGMEQNRAEQRYKGSQMNQTSAWLQSKGVDPGQANYLVQNPDALKEYWQKQQPNYQVTRGYGAGGGEAPLAYDVNKPGAPPIQIGGEAPEPTSWHDVVAPDGSKHRILQGERTGKLINADGGTTGLPDTEATVETHADGSQTRITKNKANGQVIYKEDITPQAQKMAIVPDEKTGGKKAIMVDNSLKQIPGSFELPIPSDMDPGRIAAISQMGDAIKALDAAPGFGAIGEAINQADYTKTQAAAAAVQQAAAAAGLDVSGLLPKHGDDPQAKKIKMDALKSLLNSLKAMVPGGRDPLNLGL